MDIKVVQGDLLDQDVEVIVNPWNRNVIPWWLLLPQGVSGSIKWRGGYEPFRELARCGPIPLGQAILTGAGRLKFKGIIHVAGINLLWRSSEDTIRASVRSALELAKDQGFKSIAFPLIGAGTGGKRPAQVLAWMLDEFNKHEYAGEVRVVRYVRESQETAAMSTVVDLENQQRMCYCILWQKSPETLRAQDLPPGYCGFCDKCGQPGHTRHFPGPVPYTGSWCDYHYRMLLLFDPRTGTGCLPWLALFAAVGGFIWWWRH